MSFKIRREDILGENTFVWTQNPHGFASKIVLKAQKHINVFHLILSLDNW